ncbi:BACON domain-containing protein [Paludibaculum fermentans]|uniref:BACON domain-containing protein n=1 Tax=Paludibaculum fermentans TaxID=1473598 RepID=UPI003EC0B51A
MKPLVRFSAFLTATLAISVLVHAQSTSVTVDAKANIYAAGRGAAFNGLVPPALRFAAGPGQVVSFPGVAGQIACNGIAYEPLHGPDGTLNGCGSKGTVISSWAGISGTAHKTRAMFLVGVFLDEREPADPAPDRIDLSATENLAGYSPVLGQVFFIGDGRSAGGALQQITVPSTATRLYLGFADAVSFSGAPSSYQDNNGSLNVTVTGLTPFVPGPVATGATMTVNGKSSIFWSGLDVNWPTEMPPGWKFTAAPGRVMTVHASGSVTCKDGISAPPEGTAACGPKTDLEPWGAVSGIKHPSRSMFLVGVFLNDLKPRGWPPTALNFTNDAFTTLEPLIGQTFYIGTGDGKRFIVPHDATRVFLGYARSDQMIGNPGWYYQGGGSLSASIQLTAGAATGVSPLQVDAKSNLYAAGRQSAFDGYLPPVVRLTPGPGKVLTVPQVSGKVRCCGGGYTTADGAPYHTNLNSYFGLSGIQAQWRAYFLAGVFLDDNTPDAAPPEKLVFKEPFDFPSLEPGIGQVFLIGDGLTSSGTPHRFSIPATATRLYLGFAMGRLFAGDPGYYWEASDSYTATLNISGGSPPPPSCSYSISPTALSIPAAGATGSVTVTAASGCSWTAASAVPWITVTSGAAGSGPGAVAYSVAANTGPARTGTLTVGGQTLTITQAAAATTCTYSINPSAQTVPAAGATLTVQVTAGTGCAWSAASAAPWLTVTSGSSGVGNGTVALAAAANTGAARTGTATIAGRTLTVTQAAAPTPAAIEITDIFNDADRTSAFAPGSVVFITGGDFAPAQNMLEYGVPWPNTLDGISVEVTGGGRTLPAAIGGVAKDWILAQLPFEISSTAGLRVVTKTGVSPVRTISITARNPRLYSADASGLGPVWAYHADNREVTVDLPAEPGEEILLIGAGFGAVTPPVVAGQLGVDPTSGLEPNRVSDSVVVELQGIAVPPRLAALDYLLVGAYIVYFTVPDQVNTRSPSLLVRVGGQPSQAGITLPAKPRPGTCSYSLAPASVQFSASGGSGTVSVTTSTACAWTAASEASWVRITAGASGTGSGTITYSVDANPAAATRSASITVAGQIHTVTQAGGAVSCEVTLLPSAVDLAAGAGTGSVLVAAEPDCAWTAVSAADWVKLSDTSSGTGNGTVQYTLDTNAGAARSAELTVGGQTHTVRQAGPVPATPPSIAANGVVNAADAGAAIAPGTLVIIVGANLSEVTEMAPGTSLPDQIAGVSVELRAGDVRWLAPLLLVAPGEIRAQLPFGLPEEVQVAVKNARGTSTEASVQLAEFAPRVFTSSSDGKGDARANHADGRPVSELLPARENEVVSVYVSGLGPVTPAGTAGQAGGDGGAYGPLNAATGKVLVLLDGTPAEVLFAGLAPGEVAMYRIDFRVPATAPSDLVTLVVKAAEAESQPGVLLSLGPELRPLASAQVGPDGGTVTGEGFSLTIPPGAFSRTADLVVTGRPAGPVAFSIAGLPANTQGNLTVSFEKPASAEGLNGYVVIRDPEGGETLLKPALEGNRLTLVLPMQAPAAQSAGGQGTNQRGRSAQATDEDQILLILYIEGITVLSDSGIVELFATPEEARQSINSGTSDLKRWANLFEVAYAGLLAKGVKPLPGRFYPIPVRLSQRPGPLSGEFHGEILLSRYNDGQVIHYYSTPDVFIDESRNWAYRQGMAAHLMAHYILYGYFKPSEGRTLNSRDPWLWFDEAIATWFEREMGGDRGGAAKWPTGLFSLVFEAMAAGASPTRLPDWLELLRNTAFPGPSGLAWPGPRQVPSEKWSAYARYYGQMASMFVDHLDANLTESHPEWLGELIEARRNNVGEVGLEPVRFLRDVLFPQSGLDLNVFWRDFCQYFSIGAMYADNGPDTDNMFKALYRLFAGVPGRSAWGDGIVNGVRTDDIEIADYGVALYALPENKDQTEFGRAAIGVRSNTAALAHIGTCGTSSYCYFQELPLSDFLEVHPSQKEEIRPKTWYTAMVIQSASAAPDTLREKAKVRVEWSPTLSEARMAKAGRLYCSLKATFDCTTAACAEGIGLQFWLPEGSTMNCPGGICQFFVAPAAGTSSVGYAQFLPGMIGEIKFVDTQAFLGGRIVAGFTAKKLPIAKLSASASEGDWEEARFTVTGPDIQNYISGLHFQYTQNTVEGPRVSKLKSVTFNANSQLTCGLDLIPKRLD